MKIVLGAVVGLLIGVAIVAILTVNDVARSYWPILLVGLGAGLAMRKIAATVPAMYLKGALAAVATVAAMIGGQVAAATWLSNATNAASAADRPGAVNPSDEADEAAQNAAKDDLLEPDPERPPVMAVPINSSGPVAGSGDVSPLDIGFLAVGCLVAYQLGKGNEPTTGEEADEPAEPTDTEAEPAAEEATT